MLGNEPALRKGRAEFGLALDDPQIGDGCNSKAKPSTSAIDGGNDGFTHRHHVGVSNSEIFAQLRISRIGVQMG